MQHAPEPVYDLGAAFHRQLLAARQLEVIILNVLRFYPHSLAVDLDLLFLVRHMALHDVRQLEFVRAGAEGNWRERTDRRDEQ